MKRYMCTGDGPLESIEAYFSDPEESDGQPVSVVRGRGGVIIGKYYYRAASDTIEWDGSEWRADSGCELGPVTAVDVGKLWPHPSTLADYVRLDQ